MEKMGKSRTQTRIWKHMMIISFIFYVVIIGDNEALENKIDVLVNDMVSIHCDTKVFIDIQWHHNSFSNYVYAGRILRGSYVRFRTEYDNGTYVLIIPKVRSEDAGWYYCSEETTGRQISSTHLTVFYSDPVCYSNMHPKGFIGPNTCNLEQENMVFNCVVSFNGTSPNLIWSLLNDNQTPNSATCEDKPNIRNCSLNLKPDQIYDGSIFICQTTASIDSSFNCSTEAIKILYISSRNDTANKYVNDNANCSANINGNLNVTYNWTLKQNNDVVFLSANQNLVFEKPGMYQCEVNYSIRNYSCLSIASVVNVTVESTKSGISAGSKALAIILSIGFVCAVISAGIFILIRKRRRKPISKNEMIKEKIISMYIYFTSEVNPEDVFDCLIRSGIVSQEERHSVMNEDTTEECCRALLDHLFSCSKENAFIILREALKECYPEIVKRIDASSAGNETKDITIACKQENKRIRNRIDALYYEHIVSDLHPEAALDFLIQNRVIDVKKRQFLKNQVTSEALLELLLSCTKGNEFVIFKDALKQFCPCVLTLIDSPNADDENPNNSEKIRYVGTREVAVSKFVELEAPTQHFDDSSMLREGDHFFIVGMKLHTRLWRNLTVIGAMEVFYNTGLSVVHGSSNPSTAVSDDEFFIGKDEYITKINVQIGWLLDKITFTTNEGIAHGPYGGEGAGIRKRKFVCPCEGAYLAYITGSVDVTAGATVIRRLRFFWGVPKSG